MRKFYRFACCVSAICILMTGCSNNGKTETSSVAEVVQSQSDTESESPKIEEDTDIGEHKDYDKENAESYESGSIIVVNQDGKKRGLETYTMMLGEGCLEFYANELNTQKQLLGKKVNMYSMIVPSACELYCPANERYRIDSQEEIIENVKQMLIGVEQVDVLPTLKNHNAEDIYYRSDSRWTPLGAYYAAKVFAKKADVPFADISEYTPTKSRDYIGDLQYISGPQAYSDFQATPDKFSFYAPKAKYTTNYYDENFKYLVTDNFYSEVSENSTSLFDGYYAGGYYSLKIDTDVQNERKVMIVKDEFGTLFPMFLTSSFSEIYVVSYTYTEANLIEMIKEFGITDVIYVMNTFPVTDTRVYSIETLRTQATHGSLKDDAPDSDSETDSDSNTDKLKSSDKDTDTIEYIYDVGINNQVGVIEHSDEDDNNEISEINNDNYDNENFDNDDNGNIDNDYEDNADYGDYDED